MLAGMKLDLLSPKCPHGMKRLMEMHQIPVSFEEEV